MFNMYDNKYFKLKENTALLDTVLGTVLLQNITLHTHLTISLHNVPFTKYFLRK